MYFHWGLFSDIPYSLHTLTAGKDPWAGHQRIDQWRRTPEDLPRDPAALSINLCRLLIGLTHEAEMLFAVRLWSIAARRVL